MAEKKNIIWTTGRRKSSVARVRLFPGTGTVTVNSRTLENYFPRPTSRMRILEPFEATETTGQYDVVHILEMPDGDAMTKYSIALSSRGVVRTTTVRAFTPEEFGKLAAAAP